MKNEEYIMNEDLEVVQVTDYRNKQESTETESAVNINDNQ